MYCPSCGKQTPDGSSFCLHCGTRIAAPVSAQIQQAAPTEWEYKDFVIDLEGTGAWINLRIRGYTVAGARLEFWEAIQSIVLEELQEWLDRGWQPIGEVGPGSVAIRTHRSLGKDCFTVGLGIGMIICSFGLYLPLTFFQYAELVLMSLNS